MNNRLSSKLRLIFKMHWNNLSTYFKSIKKFLNNVNKKRENKFLKVKVPKWQQSLINHQKLYNL